MTFRSVLFWLHLAAGLICGGAIGLMCFTGTVLAFEKQLVAWSERDARQIAPPAPEAPRLTLETMQARLRAAHPDARPATLVLQNDPRAAVAFPAGRTGSFYVNPYTGEVRQPHSTAHAAFMRTMTDLHRSLGFVGEVSRPRGKLVNGICNLAFFVLAVTGLYLWMPRTWSWRALKPTLWFRQNSTAKARDFNWHNVIGFWSAPVLIVLTLTALPISFRWAGNLLYTLTGTPLPAASNPGSPRANPPAPALAAPAPTPRALSPDALLAAVQTQFPDWQTLTLRLSTESPRTVTVRESTSWPRTANTTLSLHPVTGEILKRTGYAELNAAQQVRAWTRFLHTGEAVGPVGQFIAGLACLGGVFLVYTGFALSWRRFFGQKTAPAPPVA